MIMRSWTLPGPVFYFPEVLFTPCVKGLSVKGDGVYAYSSWIPVLFMKWEGLLLPNDLGLNLLPWPHFPDFYSWCTSPPTGRYFSTLQKVHGRIFRGRVEEFPGICPFALGIFSHWASSPRDKTTELPLVTSRRCLLSPALTSPVEHCCSHCLGWLLIWLGMTTCAPPPSF